MVFEFTDTAQTSRLPLGQMGKRLAGLLALILVAACSAGAPQVPEPRGLVIYSGERIRPEKARMEVVHREVTEQVDSIQADPSFLITTIPEEGPLHPWEALTVNAQGDSAEIRVQASVFEARGSYLIYAHLHLMAAQGRLDRWLPEAAGADDYELERAILDQVADTWLYQRTLFDARPYGILDELLFARERGYLDAYILTAQTNNFVDARRKWMAEHPQEAEEYRTWFLEAFRREPPGRRGSQTQS